MWSLQTLSATIEPPKAAPGLAILGGSTVELKIEGSASLCAFLSDDNFSPQIWVARNTLDGEPRLGEKMSSEEREETIYFIKRTVRGRLLNRFHKTLQQKLIVGFCKKCLIVYHNLFHTMLNKK